MAESSKLELKQLLFFLFFGLLETVTGATQLHQVAMKDPLFTETFTVKEEKTSEWTTYRNFIESLRQKQVLINKYSHGRPVLYEEKAPPTSDDWFHIVLTVASGKTITLRIRRSNLYLDGYKKPNPDQWFEFGSKGNNLISGSTPLYFGEGYDALEAAAKVKREDIKLGWTQLDAAVNKLATSISGTESSDRAKALIVVIQMISESIRFRSICNQLATNFKDESKYTQNVAETPPLWMRKQEKNWGSISEELLHVDSDPTHRFQPPPADTGIKTVEQAVEAIGMVKYYKFPRISGVLDNTVDGGQPILESKL